MKALVLLAVAQLVPTAAFAETVSYTLEPDIEGGEMRVTLTWQTEGRGQSALNVAAKWGSVADVPALIRNLRIDGASARQTGKTRWLLDHPRGATITCTYVVHPGRRSLAWDAAHAPVTNRTFFHGMGYAFLLAPQSGGGLPEEYDITLRWKLPEGWTAVCSWGAGPSVGARMSPADVRNSVYLAGRLETRRVERDGRKVSVAIVDRFGFTADEFADLAAAIVGHECNFMQEEDFPPFLVTAVPVGEPVKPGNARLVGMGLHHSFALMAAPKSGLTDAFEHLFAHELFHFWNGGLLKAKTPDKLVYWFIEGFTDYYALRILYESGHWSPAVYAKWINRHLREYDANPAIHATNEEIAERYWAERNTVGEVPYQRGLMLGLRWQRVARDHGVTDGIDALFRVLVDRGRREGFEVSNADIRREGSRVLGKWFGAEFDRYVTQAATVDVPADALAPELTGRVQAVYEFDLGFDRERSLRESCVRGLKSGSPAAAAGLREGDTLAGWKIRGDADEQVELHVLRGEKVQTIRYYPRGERRDVLQFEVGG
ncbi:MAG: hypothetical protein PVJ57_10910 [Phycisphaerae bacterium]